MLLFECNLNQDIITDMFPKNNFLREILTSWEKITNIQSQNLKHIGKQIIWNNRYIQIKKKTLIYKTWLDKGIRNIEHIYDYRTKEFYTFQKLIELYNISPNDYLNYNQLITTIPKEWKKNLKTEDIILQQEPTLFFKVIKSEHVNRLLYKFQIKKETIPEFTQQTNGN